MPMQIVFPITMVGVGITAATGLVAVCNFLQYGKMRRPVMTDEFDDELIKREKWVHKNNKEVLKQHNGKGL